MGEVGSIGNQVVQGRSRRSRIDLVAGMSVIQSYSSQTVVYDGYLPIWRRGSLASVRDAIGVDVNTILSERRSCLPLKLHRLAVLVIG